MRRPWRTDWRLLRASLWCFHIPECFLCTEPSRFAGKAFGLSSSVTGRCCVSVFLCFVLFCSVHRLMWCQARRAALCVKSLPRNVVWGYSTRTATTKGETTVQQNHNIMSSVVSYCWNLMWSQFNIRHLTCVAGCGLLAWNTSDCAAVRKNNQQNCSDFRVQWL